MAYGTTPYERPLIPPIRKHIDPCREPEEPQRPRCSKQVARSQQTDGAYVRIKSRLLERPQYPPVGTAITTR